MIMESTEKKISFGFSKISKKPTLLNKPEEKKIELIDCLEGQNIKIRDAIEVEEKPLIIPIKENKKNLVDRIKDFQEKVKTDLIKSELEDTRPDSELTIDELASREILREAKNKLSNNQQIKNNLTVPLKDDQNSLSVEGEEEPTLEDYEKIPINDYGLAMLRGMGWKEGIGIGKNPSKTALVAAPELRPKGLGLGATKIIREELSKETTCDKDGKALVLKKGALAKIIAGSHKGQYCEVQGLDDEAARVIVKTSLKGETLTVNEFFILLVTNEEYTKNAKVLNSVKFDEYKEKERKQGKLLEEKTEKNPNPDSDDNVRQHSRSGEAEKRGTHSKNGGSYSRKTDSDSDSSYESQSERYSKVHKRKDKRRHRDRSRSPPSYRHRNGRKSKSRHRSSSSNSEYDERKNDKTRHSSKRREKKNRR